MTFLAIDIGNTRLKWAQYDAPRPGATLIAHGAEFLENIDKLADGSWAALGEPRHMLGCQVAGDALKRRTEEQMELWHVSPQWVVSNSEEAGLRNGYEHPTRLGADRWVAMVGARHRVLRRDGPRPMVVVMVGTAVTVEAVDERMVQHLQARCKVEPACIMTGGAGWKMAPHMTRPFELVDNLLFDGLLELGQVRFGG